MTHFEFFWGPDYISGTTVARVVKFRIQVGYIKNWLQFWHNCVSFGWAKECISNLIHRLTVTNTSAYQLIINYRLKGAWNSVAKRVLWCPSLLLICAYIPRFYRSVLIPETKTKLSDCQHISHFKHIIRHNTSLKHANKKTLILTLSMRRMWSNEIWFTLKPSQVQTSQ